MKFIIAGLVAAGLVWVINRNFLSRWGEEGVIYLAPLLEETAKTGCALFLNAPIFYTHAVFGTVEGVVDIYSGRRRGLGAGWVSYLGHMLFGGIASWVHSRTHSIWLAILLAFITHSAWNGFVMRVMVSKGG